MQQQLMKKEAMCLEDIKEEYLGGFAEGKEWGNYIFLV